MISKLPALLAGAAATLVATSVLAAPITIDDFRTQQQVSAPPQTGFPVSSTQAAPGAVAVGGIRTMTATRAAGPNRVTLAVDPDDQIIDFSTDARTRGNASISWTGGAGWAGVDLTDGGTNDAIFVDTIFSDSSIILSWTILDMSGRTSSLSYSVADMQDGEAVEDPIELVFKFADFIGTADFTQVKTITFNVAASALSADASFNLLYAGSTTGYEVPVVPLPAGVVLMGTALGALGLLRRRKKA